MRYPLPSIWAAQRRLRELETELRSIDELLKTAVQVEAVEQLENHRGVLGWEFDALYEAVEFWTKDPRYTARSRPRCPTCDKLCHSNEEEAEEHAHALRMIDPRLNLSPVTVYYCRHARSYHVGHTEEGR